MIQGLQSDRIDRDYSIVQIYPVKPRGVSRNVGDRRRIQKDKDVSIKKDGLEEDRQEAKLEAIPRFLAFGLSVEQVAVALDLTVAHYQQAAQSRSN